MIFLKKENTETKKEFNKTPKYFTETKKYFSEMAYLCRINSNVYEEKFFNDLYAFGCCCS